VVPGEYTGKVIAKRSPRHGHSLGGAEERSAIIRRASMGLNSFPRMGSSFPHLWIELGDK
jgi:hypothetical protein